MKASSFPEESQIQQGPRDSFLDLEQRLKQKLKQKQEERQLRRSTSNVPTSGTEQDAVGDGGPNEITITDTLVSSEYGDPSSADGVMKGKTQDGSEDQRPVPSSDRSSSKQQLVPASNGSLDGERRRNTEQHHHRSRHGSRGRGNSPPSQKREWPHYPSHPRSAVGPPWNILRDDFGRAMPSQFHEDPHHPSHFYDPYYDGPPPPYYHHHHPPPPRGGDYYMRDPYYGASPRGGPPLDPHNHAPRPRGASGGRYRDRSYDVRRGPMDYEGSRRSWDLQQPLASAAAVSTDDAAAVAVLQSKASTSRVARSRSRSIASSSKSDRLSQNSYSAESEDNLSSGRRRSHRQSSPSYSSSRSSASSRASFSSDDTGQSRSKGKARTKHSKHRREDRSKRRKRAKSHKRRRDLIPHDEDEKPSISTVFSKGSGDELKTQIEMLNGKPKDAVISAVEEGKDNLSSSHESPSQRPSCSASFDDKKTLEEAEAMKRRHHDTESMSKRKRKKYKRSSRTSRSRSLSSSSVNSDSSSRSSRSSPSRCKTKESNSNDMLVEESEDQSAVTKDLRTIFISQLVMRATEHDVRKFLRKYVGVSKVKQVIFLQDKRTGRHKGCSYVELGKLSDVKKALEYDGKTPSFQRFPILIKPSEGDKNYASAMGVEFASVDESANTASAILPSYPATSMPSLISTIDSRGKKIVIQNVYIGSIDRLVTQAQLQAIFSQFGPLKNLHLPLDPATGLHRGYAFLSYSDAKSANLAIKTMAGQSIAGRQLKTGWASQASAPGVEVITSDELPEDYAERVQRVNAVLMQVNGTGLLTIPLAAAAMMPDPSALMVGGNVPVVAPVVSGLPITVQSVAEAALNAALGGPTTSSSLALANSETAPTLGEQSVEQAAATITSHILIHNMFDKDLETEDGWWEDIREDVTEECTTFGKVEKVVVMHEHPGGKVYVSFQDNQMAKTAASALEGRWFDQRQLHVDFVNEEDVL